MKKLKLVSVLIMSVVIFSISSCGSDSSPSDALKSAYDLMQSKKFEKATALYVTRDGEKFSEEEAKKMEGFMAMGAKKEFDSKDGLKNIVIDEETIDEDGLNANIKYTVHFNNGETDKEDVNLVKIDGEWYIKV